MKSSLPRRRLIPRWRPISLTLQTSEVDYTQNKPSERLTFDHGLFEESVAAWQNNPTAGHLGDVIAFAGDADLRPRVAGFVRTAQNKGWAVSSAQRDLFRDIQEESEENDDTTFEGQRVFQSRVARLRRELIVAPTNVMALLDLAQLQLASGKAEAAKRYLKTALSLAPNGRIVLRTAARFFVHLGEYERAHALITRYPGSKQDPWLIASEIALADAAKKPSTLVNVGRRLIKERFNSPASLAELAGALANKELFEGHLKEAREYLRQALRHPTDNIAAQAVVDAASMNVRLDEPEVLKAVQNSAEAQVLQAWMRFEEGSAESHALKWHAEEPFSSRPLQFLTSLQALQGEHVKALNWVKRGLIADPVDEGLLRNLAFHQAAVGDLKSADATIRRVTPILSARGDPFLIATQGLIALRRFEFERGGVLYREAEQSFKKTGQHGLAALCMLHYAKFAKEAGDPLSDKLMMEAEAKVQKNPTIDALLLLSKMSKTPVPVPVEEDQQRRLSQWVFDPVANSLTQRSEVTAKGAPSLVLTQPPNLPPLKAG